MWDERAKAAIDRSRNGSPGSAIMAQLLAAANTHSVAIEEPVPRITIFDPKEVVTGAHDAGESWQSIIWPTPAAPERGVPDDGPRRLGLDPHIHYSTRPRPRGSMMPRNNTSRVRDA